MATRHVVRTAQRKRGKWGTEAGGFSSMPRWFSIGVLSISCAAGETPPPATPPSTAGDPGALPNATVQTSTSDQAAPGTGGQLTVEQLQAVVAAETPDLKRRCWQPALEALEAPPPGPPPSARVPISMFIDASGAVTNVTTVGDPPPGFPELPACIAEIVRTWKFPSSSGTTTVNVPFVFVTQMPPPADQP